MSVQSSKVNYGVVMGPGKLAAAKVNYGVVIDTLTPETPSAGRRRQIVN